ncbi:TPA: hypothetical protein P2N04_001105 [Aeromonas salmonicida]|uniref:Uncharacterized protein n=1 Tax=Aeromonas salmonicida subsp. salmonicida TaxID=29491 RepID=A0A8F3IY25_AERSS|nr:hypothetical protein [Aeromonas salmonicida]MBM9522601.1 hypothetical protein [Aeromonas salmonicida subsp. salmonicida]QWY91841.1 hypothetical protein [Aeromonas salmonicida subsp. salmonicida]HDN9804050.1 hypothetical protein [Aeromonas salmonicida]HDO0961134.1 hypothetical protein [Aeromonas salmonicida]HDO0965761.1 hypothetical protein [Aeromonas salmonicida]
MSLLAALAKGFGAGTVNNAQVGFAEQQRLREAAQRKDEMGTELAARDKLTQKQIDASREENNTRFKAMAGENQKNRDHDWAMFERRLALETQAAAANASVRARETHAKNIMGTMDQLSKRKAELMGNDKITDEQRAVALGEIDTLGYTLASDPGAQQLLGEFGGRGYANYWLSLAPQKQAEPTQAPQQSVSPPATQPPKPQGIIPRMQGDRSIEKALIQSGREALNANKNPDAMASSAYQQMYK